MSETAIWVDNLSKLYHIGAQQQRHDTLRDALVSTLQRGRNGNGHSETDLWALKDVSFEVNRGEVVGVIGRNGAGKSTLLKILSRITEPTSGRAEIHGRVGSLLEVGTGFHPELTGRENIYLNGAILGMKRAEIAAKFDEIVQFAEVEKFLDTPVKRYSSGMYVRLAFAVAAHLEPEILLVDEVLAVGDAAFQKKCLGKMGDVAHEGRTILFVSHNMVALQTLCQNALLLEAGRLESQGATAPIVSRYLRRGLGQDCITERAWPDATTAPGNDTVRLHRVAVRAESADRGALIAMQTPVRIEVEYWNFAPGVHLHPTLHLYNDQGIVAFTASAGFEPDPDLHLRPQTGLFSCTCHIPGNLLNSGSHRLSVLLVRDSAASTVRVEDVVAFEVADNSERRFGWYGREPGVVQPMLQWETTFRA